MVDAHIETKAIFDPLKKRLPIKAFCYVRFFPDGKRLFVADNEHLETHMNWVLRNIPPPHLPQSAPNVTRVSSADALVLTTSHAMKSFYEEAITDLFSGLRLGCAFSILQKRQNYYEEFVFFPSLNNYSSYSILFSHQDLLHSAMFLFREKTHEFLKLMKPFQTSLPIAEEPVVVTGFGRKNLLEDVTARRFYLDSDSDTYLTRKEALSAFLLTQSMSSSQIAAQMGISKRTVEDHIENIKLKAGISNKFDLIQFLIRNNFNQLSTLSEL